mgnify:FL=1
MISAIVPIKEESQRVDNKNFKNINGKPLFVWIIESLLSSEYISEIIINCDEKIVEKQVSEVFDSVKFLYRPPHLKGNEVSMNKIIESTLGSCSNNSILQTHTTNPLLTSKTIDIAIKKHLNDEIDLFSVTKLQERLYNEKSEPINHNLNNLIQTQDLKPIYLENSGFYIFSKNNFKENLNRITPYSKFYETSFPENIDIDDEDDFKLAELILRNTE